MTASWSRLFGWTTFTPSGPVSVGRQGNGARFRTGRVGGHVCLRMAGRRVLVKAIAIQQRSGIVMISEISGHTAGDAGTSRFTKFGILVTIVIVLTGSAAQLINYGFFNQRIPGLDPGSDGGVFGVASDIALAAAAVSAWVLAARVRAARSVATALAGLLTFLAVDKVLRLHDYIPHWIAFYLPVLAAAFICLVAVARGHRGEGRAVLDRLIGVGLLLLGFSFLLHVFGRRLLLDLGVSDTTGLAYQTKTMMKHGTEVAGWLLIALGLLRLGAPGTRHRNAV